MKLTELKKVLKETVREVIQEELKDILLEAVKTPKVITQPPIMESFTPSVPSPTPTTPNAQSFKPNPGMDVTNGALPEGNVGMDQIMNLMNNK